MFFFSLRNWASNLRNYTWLPCMHPGCVRKLAFFPELTSYVVFLGTNRKVPLIPLKVMPSWELHGLWKVAGDSAEKQ